MDSTSSLIPHPPAGNCTGESILVESLLAEVADGLSRQTVPEATYRLQFNHEFKFRDARELAPYFAALGITHVYASPYLKAAPGSMHGYDIVDHAVLNPEVGTPEEYDAFVGALHAHGIGQILDMVPNHMGVAANENAWWMDVLENGCSSPYASFFDINWMPPKHDLEHKVLLPVLGDQCGKVLENQELVLALEDGAFFLHYHDRRFPIGPRSSARILRHRLDELERQAGLDSPQMVEYQSILTAISHLPPSTETDPDRIRERRREKEVVKRRLNELSRGAPDIASFLAENVRLFNGTRGDPRSFDLLDELLLDQAYRLSYWRVAGDEINYRRFFDLNDLAAICMENPAVFQETHKLVFKLIGEGKVNGLRIDHPDGLYDPQEYLRLLQQERLLQMCRQAFDGYATPSPRGTPRGEGRGEGLSTQSFGQPPLTQPSPRITLSHETAARATDAPSPGGTPRGEGPLDGAADCDLEQIAAKSREDRWAELKAGVLERWTAEQRERPASSLCRPLYVVVEKILGRGERVPDDWPVNGTTGYEFLNLLNGLFVDRNAAPGFDRLYARFVHGQMDFKDLAYRCKKQVMLATMSSEVSVLGFQLDGLSERNRRSRDFTLNSLTTVIREIIACFPVYRTYIGSGVPDRDRQYVEIAVSRAKRKNPATNASIFDFAKAILLLNYPDNTDEEAGEAQRQFVRKFQQVTGAVMAKGVEDTAFYIYNRLVSLNEVGSDPERFGVAPAMFHQQNLERQAHSPQALLATSTHDSKRSEDVRTRIDVLSEIPKEWQTHLFRWSRSNQKYKTLLESEPAPTRNDEYLLYQILVGTWPFEPQDGDQTSGAGHDQYVERIQQYMLKSLRESKVETSWISPNGPYEEAMRSFVERILAGSSRNAFLADFAPFAARIAECGIWNSLSQTLLKLTSPGVPDLYQGTEMWDFSLVDPDNRRPVDYARRRGALEAIQARIASAEGDLVGFVQELMAQRTDGRIKLFTIAQALSFRCKRSGLCTLGAYLPLEASGPAQEHVCAFARQQGEQTIVIAAPRLVGQLTGLSGDPPLGEGAWSGTRLRLTERVTGRQFRNVLTGETIEASRDASGDGLPLAELFRTVPLALLERIPASSVSGSGVSPL